MNSYQYPSGRSDVSKNQTVAKLRSLLRRLESESTLGNHNATNRKRRLLKLRAEIPRSQNTKHGPFAIARRSR